MELPRYYDDFIAFCQERESVRIKKEARLSEPWTEDPVLQKAFFCNVHREDDKVTRWFRENVRNRHRNDPRMALITTNLFRWFNKIETGELLMPWLVWQNVRPQDISHWFDGMYRVLDAARSRGETIFGSAYIISSPLGDPKIEWALKCAEELTRDADAVLAECTSLEAAHTKIKSYSGLGAFMAYEIVTDLRWTCVLENAPDILTWCAPGPGCARGLGWLYYNTNKVFNRGDRKDLVVMMNAMRSLLTEINGREHFPRVWEMRELEHTLCEFDKYRRVQRGDRPKRWYR